MKTHQVLGLMGSLPLVLGVFAPVTRPPLLRRHLVALLLAIAAVSIVGCATFMHGTKQKISITSLPEDASVIIDDLDHGTTPLEVTVSRKEGHRIRIERRGYEAYETVLTKGVSAWVLGNIVFGGPIGLVVGGVLDAGSGGLYTLRPTKVEATLSKRARGRSR